jgi:hypothetical protein
VINKIVHPALDNFIGQHSDKFFKMFGLRRRKGLFARDILKFYALNNAIFKKDFDFTLKLAVAPMHMNRLVLIGVKKYDNS